MNLCLQLVSPATLRNSYEIRAEFCYSSVGILEKIINQFHIILQSNFFFSYLYSHSILTSELFAARHIRVNTNSIDVYLVFRLIRHIWKCYFLLKMMFKC